MISGAKTLAERALVAAALAITAPSAAAFELAELMAMLAHRGAAHATFSEQRHVPGLDQPVVSTGQLDFEPPDRYTRRTITPHAETVTIAGNRLTLARDGRTRTMLLDATPQAVLAVEAVRATLTGDAATLLQWFRPTLAGDAAQWRLALVPLDAKAAGSLAEVRISGQRDVLVGVETRLADGTRTVTTITAAPPPGPASAAAP